MAGYLGYTVDELLTRVSARELSEWRAYERVEGPIGGQRDDAHVARILAMLYNANRGKGAEKKPGAFMDPWGKPARDEQTPEQMWAAAQSITARFGGTNHA